MLAGAGAEIIVLPAQATPNDVMTAQARRRAVVERPGRSGGDRRIRDPDDQGRDRRGRAGVRDLPRASDAGAGAGRAYEKDGPGPSWRQPSGEGSGNRQGRDRVDEPRLHRRPRHAAQGRARDARVAVRRLQLRHRGGGPAGVRRAVPPRGLARADGFALSVRTLRQGGEDAGRDTRPSVATRGVRWRRPRSPCVAAALAFVAAQAGFTSIDPLVACRKAPTSACAGASGRRGRREPGGIGGRVGR